MKIHIDCGPYSKKTKKKKGKATVKKIKSGYNLYSSDQGFDKGQARKDQWL